MLTVLFLPWVLWDQPPKNLISIKPLHVPLQEWNPNNLFFLPVSVTLNESIFALWLYQCKEAAALPTKQLSYWYTNWPRRKPSHYRSAWQIKHKVLFAWIICYLDHFCMNTLPHLNSTMCQKHRPISINMNQSSSLKETNKIKIRVVRNMLYMVTNWWIKKDRHSVAEYFNVSV